MKAEYKNWLIADHYIDAARALVREDVEPVSRVVEERAYGVSEDEALLRYAFKEIEQLGQLRDVETLESAYWFWVKTVTLGDIAWNAQRFTPKHHGRNEVALQKLMQFSSDAPSQGLAYVDASKRFNEGRNEYSTQLTSFVS